MGYDGNMLNQRLESKEEALNWMKAKQARPELVSVAQQMAARYFPGDRLSGGFPKGIRGKTVNNIC